MKKAFSTSGNLSIADICTGSGCIAVTLKKYFPFATIYGTDIDDECLKVARRNAKSSEITFLRGNLLDPLIQKGIKVDVVISNPPYIQNHEEIDEQVWKYEPHLALVNHQHFFEEIIKKYAKEKAYYLKSDKSLWRVVDKYSNAKVIFSKDMHNKMRFSLYNKKRRKELCLKFLLVQIMVDLNIKNEIVKYLKEQGHEVTDVGTYTSESCHYPHYAEAAAHLVAARVCDYGIVVCTTGEGVAITANKVKGIRCGIGYSDEVTRLMRQHNDCNMIAFGQKIHGIERCS